MWTRILLLLIGYAFGLIQTGYFCGKHLGQDLKKAGSGNTGATNAMRVLGVKAGLLVYAGDMLKALIPCLVVKLIFQHQSVMYPYIGWTGLGVILGNNYPFYLKFNGGKAVAAASGVALALDVRLFALAIALFAVVVLLTRFVSVGSMVALVGAWIMSLWILKHPGLEFRILFALVVLLPVVRHHSNISRLMKGTENRMSFGGKKR